MDSYNAKLLVYNDTSQQLRLFSSVVHAGDYVTKARSEKRLFTIASKKASASNPPVDDSNLDFDVDAGSSYYKLSVDEKRERSIVSSRNRTIHSIYDIARSNTWDYFVTLTFDPSRVDSTDYAVVSRTMSDWLSNLRRAYCPDLVYLAVPELHKDGKKWHFHLLFGNCEGLPLVDSGHRDFGGAVIYNLPTYHFGWSTATKVVDNFAVCSYVCKYITKELVVNTKFRKRFWVSRNAKRPEVRHALLSSEDVNHILVGCASDIKFCKSVGSDESQIDYIELSSDIRLLDSFLASFAFVSSDGFVDCLASPFDEKSDGSFLEPPFESIP